MINMLEPKLISLLRSRDYSFGRFINDFNAGVITGIVALPLAIAFGIASGVKPEQGLYTAVIAGFLISLLSGSRVQIGGPTGAFIVVVSTIIAKFGYSGLAAATFIAGILLVLMGVARLGSVIKYIPYPLTVGFTAGIAVIIAFTQLRDFFGLQVESVPSEFIPKLGCYITNMHTLNWHAVVIAVISILIITLWPRVTRRIPGTLIAIIVSTVVVAIFNLPVETIGTRFGDVPNSLPKPAWPIHSLADIGAIFPSAVTIALLAAIESLLSAVVADGMIGTRHRSNMELVAQGVANIFSPIFQGIPATGAIARTATNIKNGGRTPVAGMIHAITLFMIMIFFGKMASKIPLCALAAILLVVAYNMSEWRLFVRLFRAPKSDTLVLLVTFLLTVFVDLTVAIQAGAVLAAFLFIQRMESITDTKFGFLTPDEDDYDDSHEVRDQLATSKFEIPNGVKVFEINGPFFFGATSKFFDSLRVIEKMPAVLILRMRHVPAIDATGLRALEKVVENSAKSGTTIIISGIHKQPASVLVHSGLAERIGHHNIHKSIVKAVEQARSIMHEQSADDQKQNSPESCL